jgi:hypothetical protein
MKYFLLNIAIDESTPFSTEYYIKGKSLNDITNQIMKYSNGLLCTDKYTLCTHNIKFGYIREIDLKALPGFSSSDFAVINRMHCHAIPKF